MRFRRSGRPAHSRSSKAARSPGSAMAMTAANRSSSFIGLVLRLTQRNRLVKGAVEQEEFAIFFQADRAVPSYFTGWPHGFAVSAFRASRRQPLFLVFGRSVIHRTVAKSQSESGY